MLDIAALYRRHAEDLLRALRRRFRSSVPDAVIEDACTETWLIARTKRDALREDAAMGWLYTVALHEVLRLVRKQRREPAGDIVECADARTNPELRLGALQAVELLSRLNPNQRRALSLRVGGCSYNESAEITRKTYAWTHRLSERGGRKCESLPVRLVAYEQLDVGGNCRPSESSTTRSACCDRALSIAASVPREYREDTKVRALARVTLSIRSMDWSKEKIALTPVASA